MVQKTDLKVGGIFGVSFFYIIALFLPAFRYEGSSHCGAVAFTQALGAVFHLFREGGAWFILLLGWLPNALLGAGILLLATDRYRTATIMGAVGLLIGLFWIRWGLVNLEAGYYAWLLSMIMLSIVGIVLIASPVVTPETTKSRNATS